MYYYKAPYIQKGYGLGGIFRSVVKFFKPMVHSATKILNKPEVKRVLKTVGKETLHGGSKVLLDSLQGNDIKSVLNKRISKAKQKITDSIEESIKLRRKNNDKYKEYHRTHDALPEQSIGIVNSRETLKKRTRKIRRNNTSDNRKREKRKNQYSSVFD